MIVENVLEPMQPPPLQREQQDMSIMMMSLLASYGRTFKQFEELLKKADSSFKIKQYGAYGLVACGKSTNPELFICSLDTSYRYYRGLAGRVS